MDPFQPKARPRYGAPFFLSPTLNRPLFWVVVCIDEAPGIPMLGHSGRLLLDCLDAHCDIGSELANV